MIYCSNSVGNRLKLTEAGDLETPRDRYRAPMLDDQDRVFEGAGTYQASIGRYQVLQVLLQCIAFMGMVG